jgi:uncharacterized protein involved in exopolysaccharide biosynthesis
VDNCPLYGGFIIGAAIYLKKAPKIYEATATVQVEQEEQKIVKLEQVIQEDLKSQEILNTIAQKFKSRQLLEMVLESNKMFAAVGTIPPGSTRPITREDIISKFNNNVKTSLRKQTRLIDISVRDEDPKLHLNCKLSCSTICGIGFAVALNYHKRCL